MFWVHHVDEREVLARLMYLLSVSILFLPHFIPTVRLNHSVISQVNPTALDI